MSCPHYVSRISRAVDIDNVDDWNGLVQTLREMKPKQVQVLVDMDDVQSGWSNDGVRQLELLIFRVILIIQTIRFYPVTWRLMNQTQLSSPRKRRVLPDSAGFLKRPMGMITMQATPTLGQMNPFG